MVCPNCGTQNDQSVSLCTKCGYILSVQSPQSSQSGNPAQVGNTPSVVTGFRPLGQTKSGSPQTQQVPASYPPAQASSAQTPPPASAQQAYPQPQQTYSQQPQPSAAINRPPSPLQNQPVHPQQANPIPANASRPPAYPLTNLYVAQPADSSSLLNIWSPFAEFGTRRRHIGWLMDSQGPRAADLISKIQSKFNERQIPKATVRQQTLTAQDLLGEQRPFFILNRGLASVALYVNQFGRDLYVSLASYLKPPISKLRVFIVLAMIFIGGFLQMIYPAMLNGSASAVINGFASSLSPFGGQSGVSSVVLYGALFLLCIVGPLLSLNNLALFILLIYSGYRWIKNKDFFAALRMPANEFNEDDLMAMEKAVEQTVRMSIDEIGLKSDDLKPVAGYRDRLI
jgi:hypothetical protein